MDNKDLNKSSRLVKETLDLRRKIISLNSDVKKTQEEIRKHIYKMLILKKNDPHFFDKFKRKDEHVETDISNNKSNVDSKLFEKENIPKITNDLQNFQNGIYGKELNTESWFTNEEETWIPEMVESKKEKPIENRTVEEKFSFYELVHKK